MRPQVIVFTPEHEASVEELVERVRLQHASLLAGERRVFPYFQRLPQRRCGVIYVFGEQNDPMMHIPLQPLQQKIAYSMCRWEQVITEHCAHGFRINPSELDYIRAFESDRCVGNFGDIKKFLINMDQEALETIVLPKLRQTGYTTIVHKKVY